LKSHFGVAVVVRAELPNWREALKGISARTASFPEAFKRIDPPPFRFAKAFEDMQIAANFAPRLAEAFKAWEMPPAFGSAVAEALRGVPQATLADVAPRAGAAIGDAVRSRRRP
jgi:hypothetical protein